METEATTGGHAPVLLEAVLGYLGELSPGRYLDATFGGGGHAHALLEVHPENELVGMDRDPEAAVRAEALLGEYGERFRFVGWNFNRLGELAAGERFDGVLFDFGISSFHVDAAERGFSFRADGPLDMRMDPREGKPASEFLEKASRRELGEALRVFGEEPKWRPVLGAIERARGSGRLERTLSFAALVEEAVGGRRPGVRRHPATKVFQGIRMAVNGELAAIEAALPAAFERLRPGGRLAAISFHSLEDRMVKRFFRRMAGKAEHAGDHRPEQLRERQGRLLTRHPVVPGEAECVANPRARSAKLRVLEKEGAAA